jgi:ParB family chromosome partitioning protein
MAQATQVVQIPTARTKVSKFNVRKNVGDISELVLSVKSVGILEPVVARPVGKEFQVVIGSRRLAAAKKAGLKTIPAIVKKMDDDEAILESLVENLQRGDLTEEEMAMAYKTLYDFDPKTWTQEYFGKKLGKSHDWVSRLLMAFETLEKLKRTGVFKGMKAHPSQEERQKGIAPVEVLTEIDKATRADTVKKTLSPHEIKKKVVELGKTVKNMPYEDASRLVDKFKMYPEKPIPELKEEVQAASTGIALRTYLPPSVARQIEEKTGRPIQEAVTQVIERGLESIPAPSGEPEKPPMKHWAEELAQDPPEVQEGNRLKWNLERIDSMAQDVHTPPFFYTTSYSGRDLPTFIELMKAGQVSTVYDIRDTPFSQFRPEFNKENLAKSLKNAGIEYKHLPELGVEKEVREQLAKSGDYDAFWKKYDAKLREKKVHDLLEEVGEKGEENDGSPFAFLCMERDPKRCHRHRLAIHLKEEWEGVESLDI